MIRTASMLAMAMLGPALQAVPARAQSREMQTIWLIQPADIPAGDRELASGEYVLRQRVLPTGLAELEAPTKVRGVALPQGSQLIEIRTQNAKIFCSPVVAKEKLLASTQPCFIDADVDGRFDGWFNTVSQTKGLLTVGGNYPKKPKAISPLPYKVVSPETMRDQYFVGIERRNFVNFVNKESFMIAFGREGEVDRLTSPVSFNNADMPKELSILGSRIIALSESNGKMTVRVARSMPPQTFALSKTTTYRFY